MPPVPFNITPNPKSASAPTLHFHPSYFFELRDRLPADSKVWFLLASQVKKIVDDQTVHSVTFSQRFGPGGPHAFLSYAPLFHPDEKELAQYLKKHPGAPREEWEDRIKWSKTDGKRNNDDTGASQSKQLSDMSSKVFMLALGYHFGTRFDPALADKCAYRAYQLLYAFFADPNLRMLPEVIYGQYIPGTQDKSSNRPEGLLHVRPLLMVSQVLPLLPPPPSQYSPHGVMHDWLTAHVAFLQNHPLGANARSRKNNICSHYYTQLTTHLVALNRCAEAYNYVYSYFFPSQAHPQGLASRINDAGVPVEEMKRPNPFHYACFELEPLTFLADLATSIRRYNADQFQQPPPDVWPACNHALRRCIDFAIAYYGAGSAGIRAPGVLKPIEAGSDIRQLVFQARLAAVHYNCRGEYAWLVGNGGDGELEPPKDKSQWNPVPSLRGWVVAARLRWTLLEGY